MASTKPHNDAMKVWRRQKALERAAELAAMPQEEIDRIRLQREAAARQRAKLWMRKRLKNPVHAMASRVRTLLRMALSKRGFEKNGKTERILGCSWSEFVVHMEKQFLPGMSWDNRYEWHIDHIVPLASAISARDILALSHMTNLRPLWAADNLAKSDTITHLI